MLHPYSYFHIRQAIRSPIYLLNPSIIKQEEIQLPRLSILHYLDINLDNHFPTRNLVYFFSVPKNKKIPIFHITDLITKEETTTLLNKKVEQEIRKWSQNNIREFKTLNLLESPNTDINVISVYNYNLLKNMYKYKTSLLSSYYKYHNLFNTYWHYVKKAIEKDNESYHFVKIELPNLIPNYNIINVILKLNSVKYARIVNDIKLAQVLDVYKWLLNSTRSLSTLKNISDENSKRIILELSYKGYSAFLPLHIIRSMSKESALENRIKIPDSKIQKLFILTLYKIQNKINSALDEEKKELEENLENQKLENDIKEENQNEEEKIVEHDDFYDLDHSNDDLPISSISKLTSDSKKEIKELLKNTKEVDTNIEKNINLNINALNELIDLEIKNIENNEVDDIFEKTILQLESEDNDENKNESIIKINKDSEYIEKLLSNKTLEDRFNEYLKEVAEFKLLTASELRNLRKIYENRKYLKNPYNEDELLDDAKKIDLKDIELNEKDIELDIKNDLIPNNLKKEVILNFDKKYINKVMQKDIISCITDLEKAGIIVKEYTIENDNSILGNYEIHKLTLKPLDGKESTVYFRLPKINSEGEFYASGVKCRMRKQRTDLPIRKISSTKVALTSNYGKLFIFRTDRKSFDDFFYIVDFIKESYINEQNNILKIKPGNSYINTLSLPNTYANLSMHFDSIETNNYTFIFNYNNISKFIDKKVYEDLKSKNLVFIGYDKFNNILVMNYDDNIYNYSKNMQYLGDIVDLLNIDRTKIPKPFTMINILGDSIPLGVVLSYYIGLSNLISITDTKFEIIEANKQYKPNQNQIVLKFNDYKLILEPSKKEDYLLFNGFLFFKDILKQNELKDFDYKEIYLELFEHRNLSLLHLKELDLLENLFLDSITIDVLRSMNEPTDYLRLLLRANELLKNFSYPDVNDPAFSRIRGYDRVAGLMYKALTESIRDYKFKNNSRSKIELDPYKVWNYVTRDNSVILSEDNNPITDAKEIEAITLTGLDGLKKDAVPLYLRRFHKNDMGFISEATVDSGDVALNTYLTPYARFKNVRGLIDINNKNYEENKAKLFSTSVMLAPGSDQDDPKRINFINIQNGHTIPSEGYTQPLLRTGYEYLIPYKVGNLYCSIAKDDGEVIEKTDKILTVRYKNNTTESIQLGNRYGRLEGSVYSHTIITDLNKGDKFKKNDYLAYNSNFFEKDWLDSSKLILKFNRNISVALSMTNEVFEDSSAISSELSSKMATSVIIERSFLIEFNKNIVNLLPVGTVVQPNDVLFTLLDENTDYNNLSESAIEMLQSLASFSPKAKVNGVIERYEIRYNGEIQDMSPSLRKLVNKLDKELYEETRGTENEVFSGKVTSEYRVDGKNINLDTLELKVFIRVKLSMAIGDKGVFANQMKSVISDVFTENIVTESGKKIDAVFSYKGILNRIVYSPILIGTTNRLLKHVSKQVADIYFKN